MRPLMGCVLGLKKLGVIAVSLLVSPGCCELAARLLAPVRNVGPAFSVFDPVYGKRLKRNFRCERITPEFRMRLTTNSLGFRGPEPGSFPLQAVLFLGDSFTLGYGVNDGEEYPELVRQRLGERVPVVNAGLGNTGNGRWVKFLRREGPRLQPRFIVLQICDNDFTDNQAERLFELTSSGELVERQPRDETLTRAVQAVIERIPGLSYSYLVGLAQQAKFRVRKDAGAERGERGDRLTYRILEEGLRLCQANQWPTLGLSVDLEGERLARVEALFASFSARLVQVPHRREHPELYYRVDAHWNAAGHAEVARLMMEQLLADRRLASAVSW